MAWDTTKVDDVDILMAADYNEVVTQIKAKQPADATLTALAGVTTAANKIPYFTGSDTAGVADLPSNKNYIQNPGFLINQRGLTSVNTAWTFPVDRWIIEVVGSSMTSSQQAFTLGQTAVPGEPSYYLRNVVSSVSGAANRCRLLHQIENVRNLAGKTVTLSFYAKADTAKNIAVEFIQDFGTGGSPSSAVTTIGVTTVALTTGFVKKTVTATLPSISGKTLGTAGNSNLSVSFWFDAGSNYNARTNSLGNQSGTFEIANVKLEEGSIATPFVAKSYGEELQDCMRYYQKSQTAGSSGNPTLQGAASFIANTTIGAVGNVTFSVPMRTTPTIILYDSLGNAGGVHIAGVGDMVNFGATPAFASPRGFQNVVSGAGTWTVDQNILAAWTASAELV